MYLKKILILTFTALLLNSNTLLARMGTESSGGGDASETRVNEIRSDILKWINEGGAKGLELPNDVLYNDYVSNMIDILSPKKVIISFTEEQVVYHNTEKICRSFNDEDHSEMHTLCNISRFKKTSDSDQYKLIHHEYAILAKIEKDEGVASDYNLSSQITDFLDYKKVLRMAVKKTNRKDCTLDLGIINNNSEYYQDLITDFKRKTYIITSKEKAKYSISNFKVHCSLSPNSGIETNSSNPAKSSCDETFASLSLKNNVIDQKFDFLGYVLKTEPIKPTIDNAIIKLLNRISKCIN